MNDKVTVVISAAVSFASGVRINTQYIQIHAPDTIRLKLQQTTFGQLFQL